MISFNEENHTYHDGEKELISVTTLLKKHGLGANYSSVNPEVLNRKAIRGTLIHEEIENYIKNGELGITKELYEFVDYITKNNIEIIASEKMVYNDICAGRFDLLCKRNGKVVRVDYKATYKLEKNYVDWQLNVYDYLDDVKADELEVWHFLENGEMEIVSLPFRPIEQVEGLFEAERKGEIYKMPLIDIEEQSLAIILEATTIIERAKAEQAEAEKRLEDVKAALIKTMEENCIKKFENDEIVVSYISSSIKTTIDTKSLKKDLPDIAKKYEKTSTQKASVRIALKGEK